MDNLFYSSLSQKFEIKITDIELEEWIKTRTPDMHKEDLIYTLKANNLTYSDWKGLFRNQMIKNQIIEKLLDKSNQDPTTSAHKKNKLNKKNNEGLYLAVISFDEELDAKKAYKRIRKDLDRFDDVLEKVNGTRRYSWVKKEDLGFYDKIKGLSLKRSSKPIETKWGYSLVRIEKKGQMPEQHLDVAPSQDLSAVKELLEDFRKDPELQINTDLLYSLKIKR